MPRRMSFARTIEQMRARTKTVTRRLGWWVKSQDSPLVLPGEHVIACEKTQGLKRGERQRVIRSIEIVSIWREPLGDITPEDCAAEGFPGMTPSEFVSFFGHPADTIVTRIRFRHLHDRVFRGTLNLKGIILSFHVGVDDIVVISNADHSARARLGDVFGFKGITVRCRRDDQGLPAFDRCNKNEKIECMIEERCGLPVIAHHSEGKHDTGWLCAKPVGHEGECDADGQ